jgi:hypothetical protein
VTIAILVMLGIGATCGIILSVASKVFYVYEDPRIAEVEYFLAGANCGGCGFAAAAPRPWPSSKARPAQASVSRRFGGSHQHRRCHGCRSGNGRTPEIPQPLQRRRSCRGQIHLQRRHDLRGHDRPLRRQTGLFDRLPGHGRLRSILPCSTPSTWAPKVFR